MEEYEEVSRVAHERFMQSVSATHIFCVTALEAHINTKSMDNLHGRLMDQFEKVSLEGKWLMFPKLLGHAGFDLGKQPYQDVTKLIKIRNGLVHYETKSEKRDLLSGPAYKKGFGMTLKDAERSIKATKNMVLELSRMLNERAPQWIEQGDRHYLRFDKNS